MRDARRIADNLSAHQCTKSHIVIAYSQMPRTKATTKPATREAAMFMAMRTRSLYLPTIINPSLRLLRSVLINRDCSAIGGLPQYAHGVSNRF